MSASKTRLETLGRGAAMAAAVSAAAPACAAPQTAAPPSPPAAQERPAIRNAPVSGLPFAHGRSFATLDHYLAYLAKQRTFDGASWVEVEPGLYQWVPDPRGYAPVSRSELRTRDDLLKLYGFSR